MVSCAPNVTTSACPWALRLAVPALVPPLRLILHVVTPARTQRRRMSSTEVALSASPLKSITVPSDGIHDTGEKTVNKGQLPMKTLPALTSELRFHAVKAEQLSADRSLLTVTSSGVSIMVILDDASNLMVLLMVKRSGQFIFVSTVSDTICKSSKSDASIVIIPGDPPPPIAVQSAAVNPVLRQ